METPKSMQVLEESETPKNIPSAINIYPNPANEILNITSSVAIKNVNFCVRDITGKVIYVNSVAELKTHSIDIKEFAPGTYMLIIGMENKPEIHKFMVIR